MATKQGRATYLMQQPPSILSFGSVGSKKEAQGPLAPYFDLLNEDSTFAQQSWEKAESRMQKEAVATALAKAALSPGDMDAVFAGDLLNQCIGSTFGLRELGVPFVGLYGACSTMAEAMVMGSLLVDGGGMRHALAVTSSHFCTAERQYRFPLEYGGQRPPTSQWTVTGSGAVVLGRQSQPPYVRAVTIGTIEDKGIKDANNMGAAMAPAACRTIQGFFEDTLTNPDNYDLILTGDLGEIGSQLLYELMDRAGYDIRQKHSDCGLLIYDREKQDVHAGGSGCGCAASVLCSYILPAVREGRIQNMLFIATGALLSPTSTQQGESIPAIAHLVQISHTPKS